MSQIRCVYRDVAPDFPATEQHPEAVRYGPMPLPNGGSVFVDALDGEPTLAEVMAIVEPPLPPAPTPAEKLAAAGLTVSDLRLLLNLPA